MVGPGESAVAGVVRVGGGGPWCVRFRSSAVFTHVCVVVVLPRFRTVEGDASAEDGNPDNVVSAAVKRSSPRFSPIYPPEVEWRCLQLALFRNNGMGKREGRRQKKKNAASLLAVADLL